MTGDKRAAVVLAALVLLVLAVFLAAGVAQRVMAEPIQLEDCTAPLPPLSDADP